MRREIIILSRSLPHHGLGGMEIVAWDLAVEFMRSGHTVRVVTTSLPDRDGEFFQEGVHVVPLASTPSGRYSRAWWRESRKYFEAHCMNAALGVLSVSAAGFGLLPLKDLMPDVPIVMQAHGTSWGEVVSKWRSRHWRSILSSMRNFAWLVKDLLAYRKFDAVVAVGERVRRDLTRPPVSWVLPEERVCLINNGIDTSLFYPSHEERLKMRERSGIPESAPVVISASRLHAQKGVAHGLKALQLLLQRFPEVVYLIAGDGPERAPLEALTHELGIAENVRFLGAQARNKLAGFLQAADVFLFLTGRVEGLPLNILEALASGLACTVSDHLDLPASPCLHEVMPSDVGAVAEVLAAQLHKRSSRLSVSALPEQFALRLVADRYLNLLCADHGKGNL